MHAEWRTRRGAHITEHGTHTATAAHARFEPGFAAATMVRLRAVRAAEDTPWSAELSPADDRLRRRERLLHHLAMERQRRRRRTA